jgi:K+-sensing histidine kinase KdpD
LVYLLYRRIKLDKLEEEKKRFALQTLTHELRTPITNLALVMEQFRNDYDSIPETSKDSVLRLFNEVERLKRVVDASKQYLINDSGSQMIKVQPQKIESIKNFIDSILEIYSNKIQVTFTGADHCFKMDSYWVTLCIKNIIDNAINHGTPPILVSIELTDKLEVKIPDAGIAQFNPNKKGDSSHGLGIGFQLVKKVMDSLNGKMEIYFKPTKVVLIFKEQA